MPPENFWANVLLYTDVRGSTMGFGAGSSDRGAIRSVPTPSPTSISTSPESAL